MEPIYNDDFLRETLRHVFEDEEYYCVPKGIVRFDYANSHGWWVRVTRDRAQFKQLFSDGQYGSIASSLREAVLYRHEILSSFPVTIKQIHSRSLPLDPEERITRVEEKGRKQPYIAWKARWYDKNHVVKNQSFSVRKFGEEEARALALAAAHNNHNKKPKLSRIPDNYFTFECKKISRADVEVLATIDSGPQGKNGAQSKPEVSRNPFAFEGEKKLVLHMSIERDRKLRDAKLTQFAQTHGKIFCELCGFNFADSYPFLRKDIIEVHHIIPLSTLTKATESKLSDLMLLCSNCHFAIHQGDAEENLILAMDHFEDNQSIQSENC